MSIEAIKFFDRHLGGIICAILGVFSGHRHREEFNAKSFKNILVVQLWGVGESILTLPSICALSQNFSNIGIDVLVTQRNKDVYFGNNAIKRLIKLDTGLFSIISFILSNFRKYDVVIDMEEYLNISSIISFFVGKTRIGYSHNARSRLYTARIDYNDKQHVAQTFLDLARVLKVDYKKERLPNLVYTKLDEENVEKLLKKSSVENQALIIGIAPGAAESAKCRMWPYDKYAELCNTLITNYSALIVFVGTKEEKRLIEAIEPKIIQKNNILNLAGMLSLRELSYFVKKCKLFISNDSGAMHVAAVQGTKTIGLFGPNLPVRFGPYGKGNIAIYKGHNCKFSPCINVHKGEVPDCLYQNDSEDYQKCMKNISVEDVLGKVEKMMG